VGKRSRTRDRPRAPTTEFHGPDGGVLVLRGSLTPATRLAYAEVLHDERRSTEDSWHRAVEFLFERLAVRWTVNDVPTEGERALLARFRMASQDERRFVRDALREHVAATFPELEAP
jgi:surface antigen